MGETPGGAWILVVGMHRSGTSAITGGISELGLNPPARDDLMTDQPGNPNHYESVALTEFDDRLLAALGGTWSAPPTLSSGWERSPSLSELETEARAAMARAFPGGGISVWKDPRLCILLPYWRRVLPSPLAAVYVWRSPMAVARSLQRRDGFALSHGIALWDRNNRQAIANLAGLEVLVVSYEEVLADPMAAFSDVATWIDGSRHGPRRQYWDLDAAAANISGDLWHEKGEGDLQEDQQELVRVLTSLGGSHRQFIPPPLDSEPQWVIDQIAQRGELDRAYVSLDAAVKATDHFAKAYEEIHVEYLRLLDDRKVLLDELDKARADPPIP